jgi:hypothetical protein
MMIYRPLCSSTHFRSFVRSFVYSFARSLAGHSHFYIMSRFCRTLTVVTSILWPIATHAQFRYNVPSGRVEVLGLKRWTLRMLQDSVRKYVPGQELHDAACMAILREKLHFADAYVSRFQGFLRSAPDSTFYSIRLVEPKTNAWRQFDDRERIEYTSLRPAYAQLIQPITDSSGGVETGRLHYWLFFRADSNRQSAFARMRPEDRADGTRVYEFLGAHTSETDRQTALRTLERDGFWANRVVATAVLQNFGDSAGTWIAVAKALRDPHEQVRSTAAIVIGTLSEREVDWSPALADLRLLLSGANVSALDQVMRALVRTKVRPSLARGLLRRNADWVLQLLRSEDPTRSSDAAHRFLVQLNRGIDLGRDPRVWSRWVAGL